MIFENFLVVLVMNHGSLINEDFRLVPFAERFLVLRHGRNHVVQRCALTVAIFSKLCVRMVGVIENLIFRSRDVDRLPAKVAVLVFCLDFLSEVEYS